MAARVWVLFVNRAGQHLDGVQEERAVFLRRLLQLIDELLQIVGHAVEGLRQRAELGAALQVNTVGEVAAGYGAAGFGEHMQRRGEPPHVLTESSRTIAGGDFSHRVHLKSRTEFGELAQTFNTMTDDLEQFVDDLKKAAQENRALFLSSIQMLAGAVDEKDPYTRGHS